MSRKSKAKTPNQKHKQPHQTPSGSIPISIDALKEQWLSLHLSSRTQMHLEQLFQEEGAFLALAATTALSLEQVREKQPLSQSFFSWGLEELRLLLLEGSSAHLVDSSRMMIDAVLAWNVFQLPLAFPQLLFLILAAVCLLSYCGINGLYQWLRVRLRTQP